MKKFRTIEPLKLSQGGSQAARFCSGFFIYPRYKPALYPRGMIVMVVPGPFVDLSSGKGSAAFLLPEFLIIITMLKNTNLPLGQLKSPCQIVDELLDIGGMKQFKESLETIFLVWVCTPSDETGRERRTITFHYEKLYELLSELEKIELSKNPKLLPQ